MMLSPVEPAPPVQSVAAPPPHNLQAEQGLLGAILLDNAGYDRVSDIVTHQHFYDPLHASIFEITANMIVAGRLASPITLKAVFETAPPISSDTTVIPYIGRLVARAPSIRFAKDYAQTIAELAKRRALIVIGEDLVQAAYEAAAENSSTAMVEEVEARLFAIAESGEQGAEVTFAAAAHAALLQAQAAHARSGALSGLSTGISDLDHALGGLAESDLIVLAGRPAMGKTALATNIAWNVARSGSIDADGMSRPMPVGFFSLEMSSEQLAMRIIATESNISVHKINRGMTTAQELERIARGTLELSQTPLVIDSRGGISIAKLMARARRMKRRYGIGLLVVDYLQLLAGSKKGDGNRVQEVTEITTGLKALAKELSIPIIALSQLSRQVENREDKRPQLSDLRESGSIEQDADVVMFVFREEYYVEKVKPDDGDADKFLDWQERLLRVKGKAEVIIGKHRHGPTSTVQMAFQADVTRFANLARHEVAP